MIRLIIEENKKLKERVNNIEEVSKKLDDDLADIEIVVDRKDRYSRRNNIEIGGIPDHFHGDQLENVAISILNKLDVQCANKDLEACHRLPLTKKEEKFWPPEKNNSKILQ